MNSSMFIACSPYFTYTPNTVYSVPYVLVPNLSTPNNSLTIYLNAPPTDLSLALARYILEMHHVTHHYNLPPRRRKPLDTESTLFII